jgi:hypothetical protein
VLGENTVKTRMAHVLGKLELRDRVHAVVLAYETGLWPRPAHGGAATDARSPRGWLMSPAGGWSALEPRSV